MSVVVDNIQISSRLHSDSIDWFYLISLNLYSKQLDYLIELEVNRKKLDNLALWKIFLATNFPLSNEMKLKFLILDIILPEVSFQSSRFNIFEFREISNS